VLFKPWWRQADVLHKNLSLVVERGLCSHDGYARIETRQEASEIAIPHSSLSVNTADVRYMAISTTTKRALSSSQGGNSFTRYKNDDE
jgi:hypothetical protein